MIVESESLNLHKLLEMFHRGKHGRVLTFLRCFAALNFLLNFFPKYLFCFSIWWVVLWIIKHVYDIWKSWLSLPLHIIPAFSKLKLYISLNYKFKCLVLIITVSIKIVILLGFMTSTWFIFFFFTLVVYYLNPSLKLYLKLTLVHFARLGKVNNNDGHKTILQGLKSQQISKSCGKYEIKSSCDFSHSYSEHFCFSFSPLFYLNKHYEHLLATKQGKMVTLNKSSLKYNNHVQKEIIKKHNF